MQRLLAGAFLISKVAAGRVGEHQDLTGWPKWLGGSSAGKPPMDQPPPMQEPPTMMGSPLDMPEPGSMPTSGGVAPVGAERRLMMQKSLDQVEAGMIKLANTVFKKCEDRPDAQFCHMSFGNCVWKPAKDDDDDDKPDDGKGKGKDGKGKDGGKGKVSSSLLEEYETYEDGGFPPMSTVSAFLGAGKCVDSPQLVNPKDVGKGKGKDGKGKDGKGKKGL